MRMDNKYVPKIESCFLSGSLRWVPERKVCGRGERNWDLVFIGREELWRRFEIETIVNIFFLIILINPSYVGSTLYIEYC